MMENTSDLSSDKILDSQLVTEVSKSPFFSQLKASNKKKREKGNENKNSSAVM